MQPGEARLAIDYGTAATVAVLAWSDGRWQLLLFDGGPVLPSAVFIAEDGLLVGAHAGHQATAAPQRLVEFPLRHREVVTVAGGQVPVADLVAATLSRVAVEAGRVAGGPVADVRLVVPAGWGPRRRTWMRQAAHRAGLGQPRLVEAPVAVAGRLAAAGARLQVGDLLLVVDVGADCEASVLRRGPGGFEVLSTVADPDAGGARIDDEIILSLLTAGAVPPEVAADWSVRAGVRAAKEALSLQPAMVVALPPPHPPVVIGADLVARAAAPVADRVGALAVQALTAAETDPGRLSGVYLTGGAASVPAVLDAVARHVGIPPVLADQPGIAAAVGAADAYGHPGGTPPAPAAPVPPLRRAAAMTLPGLASLALYTQYLLTADWHLGNRISRSRGFYVIANWGELAVAAVFALLACLSAAAVLGPLLGRGDPPVSRPGTDRVPAGIAAATATGLAAAGLYAVLASLYFGLPITPFLRWALLPLLPAAAIAVTVATLAQLRRLTPPGGWSTALAFPGSSVIIAAAGMLLSQYALSATRWPYLVPWLDLAGWTGGLLLGVGCATALVRPTLHRVIVAAPLALICAAIAAAAASGILGVIYALAVAGWWTQRLWQLLHTPAQEPTHAWIP
jgi:hypothetical protein